MSQRELSEQKRQVYTICLLRKVYFACLETSGFQLYLLQHNLSTWIPGSVIMCEDIQSSGVSL